jgi:hypothetical protein
VKSRFFPGGGWLPLAVAAVLAETGLGSAARGADPPIAWLTGSALRRQLDAVETVYWSGTPLRDAITGFSRARRIAVLIDRRVDPGQSVELRLSGQPVEAVLGELAASLGIGVCWMGPVAYFGPVEATSRARTVAQLRREEIRRLPIGVQRKLHAAGRIRWDDFAEPRDLVVEMATEIGLEISGLDQVPHDLWAEADLPPLAWVDRLALVVGQFDLTFQVAPDGSRITLVPVPDDVMIERDYSVGRQAEQLASQWAALVPDSQIDVVGGTITVRGLLEDHERIANSLRSPRPRPTPDRPSHSPRKDEGTVTGKVSGELGDLLDKLAARYQLSLKIDRAALREAGISLHQHVSCTVKDATVDELFEAVLSPAGCTFSRAGSAIEIGPAP